MNQIATLTCDVIHTEYLKQINDEWKNSPFEEILHVCCNDRGNIGEKLLSKICKECNNKNLRTEFSKIGALDVKFKSPVTLKKSKQ